MKINPINNIHKIHYIKINTYYLITIYYLVKLPRLNPHLLQLVSKPMLFKVTEVVYIWIYLINLLIMIKLDLDIHQNIINIV